MKQIIFTVLFSLPVFTSAQLQWRRINFTGVAPAPRRDASIGWDKTNNVLYIFGGRAGSVIFGDTWKFTMSTKSWTKLPDQKLNGHLVPENRFSIVFGTWNSFFYITTGEGQSSTGKREFYNDVYRLDFSTDQWTRAAVMSGEVPRARYGASGGIHPDGNFLFLTHGFAGTRYSDTFKFDLRTNRWIKAHGDINPYDPFKPHARCLQSGTMLTPSKMLMYGGCASGGKTGGPCPSQDNWLFDDSNSKWEEQSTCASPRIYSSMAILPTLKNVGSVTNVAVLYGGEDSNDEIIEVTKERDDEFTSFDATKKEWSKNRAAVSSQTGSPKRRAGQVMVTVDNGIIMFGGQTDKLTNELWLLYGKATEVHHPSLSLSCEGRMTNFILVHGILMFLSWGFFLQIGAFLARYLKNKDPLWFHLHRIFQMLGLVIAIPAFGIGIKSVRFDHFQFAHGGIGLVIMILGILQPLNALIRPHLEENKPKSRFRKIWEIIHKGSGRLALLLAIVNITLGLFLGVAMIGVWAVWLVYVCILVLVYILAEIRKWVQTKVLTNDTEMSQR